MSEESLHLDLFARALNEYSDQSKARDGGEADLDELGLDLLPDLVRHAASVVLEGWPVLAIRKGTKKPLHTGSVLPNHGDHWLRSVADVEAAYIEEEWGCQFAVMTGVPNTSGECLIVLDADVDGQWSLLDELLAEAGSEAIAWASNTLEIQRFKDRAHFCGVVPIEDCPPSSALITETLAEGKINTLIEWRGTGGYVLLPGAKHPDGQRYQITRSAPPLRVPRGLIELVRVKSQLKAQPKPAAPMGATSPQPPDDLAYEDLDGPAKARIDAYMAGALDGIIADLVASKTWPEGRKDDRGRGWDKLQADAAFRLAQLVLAAWNPLDEDEAYDVFVSAAPTDAKWTATKQRAKWRSQWALAMRKGPAPYPDDDTELLDITIIDDDDEEQEQQEQSSDHTDRSEDSGKPSRSSRGRSGSGGRVEIAPGIWVDAEKENAFWKVESRGVIREWAHARRCSPYSLLMVSMLRLLVAIPPHVVLPPLIGDVASLNLFIALVAPTGGGKDRAQDVARKVIHVVDGARFVEPPIGTGEGLVSVFGHMEGKGAHRRPVMHEHNALIRVAEVDNWARLIERKGSNLETIVRQASMGQQLGFSYRGDPTTLPAHSYRLCLSVGVQAEHAESLLGPKAISGGTAGRFVWTPGLSKDRPPRGVRPDDPPALVIVLPQALKRSTVIQVAKVVEDEVLDDSYDRLGGESNIDPIDAYGLLMRERMAFGLGALEHQFEIDEENWMWSGHLLDVSRAVRAKVAKDLGGAAQRRAVGAAVVAQRAADVAVRESRVWKNCFDRVPKVLEKAGEPMSVPAISDKISVPQREHLDDVLAVLAVKGVVDLDSDDLYGLTRWRS